MPPASCSHWKMGCRSHRSLWRRAVRPLGSTRGMLPGWPSPVMWDAALTPTSLSSFSKSFT